MPASESPAGLLALRAHPLYNQRGSSRVEAPMGRPTPLSAVARHGQWAWARRMKRKEISGSYRLGSPVPSGWGQKPKKIINKTKVKGSKALGCQNGAGWGCGCLSNGLHICLSPSAVTRTQDAQWALQGAGGESPAAARSRHTPVMAPSPAGHNVAEALLVSSRSCIPAPTAPPCSSWVPAGLHRLFALLMPFSQRFHLAF